MEEKKEKNDSTSERETEVDYKCIVWTKHRMPFFNTACTQHTRRSLAPEHKSRLLSKVSETKTTKKNSKCQRSFGDEFLDRAHVDTQKTSTSKS